MKSHFIDIIAAEVNIQTWQVENTIVLLDEGATVPFISRYRKEKTGTLDEVAVLKIEKLNSHYKELAKRKQTILKTIEEQGKLTSQLEDKIFATWDTNVLEDLYLPFKPKRRTRGTMAKEKGLEPMAKIIMSQRTDNLHQKARSFITKECSSIDDVLAGARDIIAEWVNENETIRSIVRSIFERTACITSKVVKAKKEDAIKYSAYFDFDQRLNKTPSHRILAILRGETEGYLRVNIEIDSERAIERLERFYIKQNNQCTIEIEKAISDSYKRLLFPSIEKEYISIAKAKADDEAIIVFTDNLSQLLLSAPLGEKRVLAIDPGYRTGCKVVCLNNNGNLIYNETIFPHPPQNDFKQASHIIKKMIHDHTIEAVAIGNGTASRETESFVKSLHLDLPIFIVNEDGASIYSASEIAREEFPNQDITVRGAVSIGRRLIDPLAELVKIDPKSIGVGQYQHDVDQKKLKLSLDQTVQLAVNKVGVNLNTASKYLLRHISGLGPQLADNIIKYREYNGSFKQRKELKKVGRMGAKTYEQCVGFLRIPNATMPLDNSAVHPEAYNLVTQMAKDLKVTLKELIGNEPLIKQIIPDKYVDDTFGLPTINDILKELVKPSLDPRDGIETFEFDPTISVIEDLHEGMVLPGIIVNITKFGAFVDIGIKQSGLVHISEMADKYISDPNEVVKLQQKVKVKIIELDLKRGRIQLSIKRA